MYVMPRMGAPDATSTTAASFDAARPVIVANLEPAKLPFERAPHDDRGLPDLHFGLYRQVVVFD